MSISVFRAKYVPSGLILKRQLNCRKNVGFKTDKAVFWRLEDNTNYAKFEDVLQKIDISNLRFQISNSRLRLILAGGRKEGRM